MSEGRPEDMRLTEGPKVALRDWSAIEDLFVAGVSLRQLAERYGVPKITLQRRAQAGGWMAKRAAAEQAVARVESAPPAAPPDPPAPEPSPAPETPAQKSKKREALEETRSVAGMARSRAATAIRESERDTRKLSIAWAAFDAADLRYRQAVDALEALPAEKPADDSTDELIMAYLHALADNQPDVMRELEDLVLGAPLSGPVDLSARHPKPEPSKFPVICYCEEQLMTELRGMAGKPARDRERAVTSRLLKQIRRERRENRHVCTVQPEPIKIVKGGAA